MRKYSFEKNFQKIKIKIPTKFNQSRHDVINSMNILYKFILVRFIVCIIYIGNCFIDFN